MNRAAEHKHWPDCTRPSIIAFAILNLLGLAVNVALMPDRNALSVGILAVCYLAIIVAFARITASGFRRMSQRAIEPTDIQRLAASPEPGATAAVRSTRLLSGCAGLVIGFAVGLGIAIYLDHGGWHPANGWQTRLLTALVVAGIGGVLGLVSGPVRR